MHQNRQPRVYPLDDLNLSQEQMAVIFAMTSRSPEPFDEIAERVSVEKASDFHERWVLDYGHASVAEHAVVHLAIENISRVACDMLEANRLASYTEKSSRYQVIARGDYHTPAEILRSESLTQDYRRTIDGLFEDYENLMKTTLAWLEQNQPKENGQSASARALTQRRLATDACRNVLPASILTNVGMTANARTLEHAISKLMSSKLQETSDLGTIIRDQGRHTIPTLIKYADYSDHLNRQHHGSSLGPPIDNHNPTHQPPEPHNLARLVEFDDQATHKLATAILYRNAVDDYNTLRHFVRDLTESERLAIISDATASMGPHDPLPREFEVVDYTFELTMDYGALREFNRQRMMTPMHRNLTTALGIRMPTLMVQTGQEEHFERATQAAEKLQHRVKDEVGPEAAQYLVTHAHLQTVAAKMNLRQLHHIIRLRTSPRAHEAIRGPIGLAAEKARRANPGLVEAMTNSRE